MHEGKEREGMEKPAAGSLVSVEYYNQSPPVRFRSVYIGRN